MEINLEKIELVKDRTGATYAEAKEALEKADGSVVDAIIDLEERMNRENDAVDGGSLKDSPVFAKMKEIVDKGNVTRIMISKGDRSIVNFPLTAGVIGAALVPWGAILGIIAAVGTQCDIEFVNDKGEVIDINGKVIGIYDRARDIAMKSVDKAFGKADPEDADAEKVSDRIEEVWNKFGESGTVDDIRDAFVTGTAKLMMLWDKLEKSGKIDDVRDTVEKVAKKAADTAKGIAKDAADRAEKAEAEFAADADKAAEEEFKDEEI